MTLKVVNGGDDRHRAIDEDVEKLFDYLDAHPEGVTYSEAEDTFEWPRRYFYRVVFEFRKLFATDIETLVCIRDEEHRRGPWIYKWATIADDVNEWTVARVDNMVSQLLSLERVSSSAMKVFDGRSTEGKIVRAMNRIARHARETIEEIRAS